MRLIQFIFYFSVGYLLWKLVRAAIRSLNRTGDPPPGSSSSKQPPPPKRRVFQPEEIKDAEFEDITPPAGTSSKSS
jgi:hypothetical protein